jgi:hypothetical protein
MEAFVEFECDCCSRKTVHDVIDLRDGEDSWKIIIIQCSECGKEKEYKVYSC